MVATVESEEDQTDEAVASPVELSMKVAVALNPWVAPTVMTGFAGLIARAFKALMSRVVVVIFPPKDALIVVLPVATPVASPGLDCPALWMVALLVSDEDQFAELVTSAVELSL